MLSTADGCFLPRFTCGGGHRWLKKPSKMAQKVSPIFVETVDELTATILNVAQDKDVVLVMGAGSVSGVALAC